LNRKKITLKKLIPMVCVAVFIAAIYFYFIPLNTKIIPIPGGKEYGVSSYNEYFVVFNPPRTTGALSRLILEYNESNPINAIPPPDNPDWEYVYNYRRRFFKESDAFPRDIQFTDQFRPENVLTDDYNYKDMIADILGSSLDISYSIDPIVLELPWLGFFSSTLQNHRSFETPSDPTLNGLYNNIPEKMIPLRIRDELGAEFFERRRQALD